MNMRFVLNGQFSTNGQDYWRIEDTERMVREIRDGTYDPIATLRRFDIAINAAIGDADFARRVVDALNGVSDAG